MAYDNNGFWYEDPYVDLPIYDEPAYPDNTYVPYDNSGGQPGGTLPGTGVQMPPEGAVGKDTSGNWVNALGQIVAPFITSAITPWMNNIQSGGLLNRAEDLLKAGGSGIASLQAPNLMALIPQLQRQVQQGTMTAAQAQAALQQASEMQNVQSNQASIGGARTALDQLANVAQSRGLSEADRAQFAALMNQQNADASQQRKAQIQQMQMQGNAGTGTELAARLLGAQGAANSNAAAGATIAQSAQARALQAMQSGVTGNTNLNSQLFDQAAKKAAAQDAINQFNTQAKNTINLGNVANQQAANLANFNMANTIAGKNTDIANEEKKLPLSTANQQFKNALDQQTNAARAQIGAGSALGNMATQQITRSTNAGLAGPAAGSTSGGQSGGGSVSSDIGQAVNIGKSLWDIFSDEKLKTDKEQLSDDDVDSMMAKLTAYKYRYKGDQTNPQQQGVMAQDMEQGMGSVVNTPAGKMIQGPEALSKALAVLANNNERIRRLEGK